MNVIPPLFNAAPHTPANVQPSAVQAGSPVPHSPFGIWEDFAAPPIPWNANVTDFSLPGPASLAALLPAAAHFVLPPQPSLVGVASNVTALPAPPLFLGAVAQAAFALAPQQGPGLQPPLMPRPRQPG